MFGSELVHQEGVVFPISCSFGYRTGLSLCGGTSDAARGHKLNESNEKHQYIGRCILKVFWVQYIVAQHAHHRKNQPHNRQVAVLEAFRAAYVRE